MKKFFIAISLLVLSCSCSTVDTEATSTTNTTKIKYYRNDMSGYVYSIEVEDHLYIVCGQSYGGCIVHAEHCPCKNR